MTAGRDAAAGVGQVHEHPRGMYDLEVDTSRLRPDECATQVLAYLSEHRPPGAFERLATEVLGER